MKSVRYFHGIHLPEWPREAIYRRLGFRRSATTLTEAQRAETERSIQEAMDLIRLKGALLRLPLRIENSRRSAIPDGTVFESAHLAGFLRNCREVVFMGATAGEAVMEAIKTDMAQERATRAVVLDATASEAVDAALDWIMTFLAGVVRREGRSPLKTRYSAGYGDLALENQRQIHRLLGMDRLGVSLTDHCVLVPEKSVTAITGIV
jgi:hypothetical protein